jgi:hypothetical protein
MRSGMPRTIGCLLLLLIILWHFDGALRESTDVQRVVNNLSAYVSNVAISKDVVVLDHKEQKTSVRRFNIVKFHLICWRESVSLFPRPICRGWGPEVLSASNDDVTYNVSQIGINSKNELPTTHPWGYGRGEPIVLVLVTQYGGTNFFTGYARMGRWLASYSGQSEARKNGPDIGARSWRCSTSTAVSHCLPVKMAAKAAATKVKGIPTVATQSCKSRCLVLGRDVAASGSGKCFPQDEISSGRLKLWRC